MSASNSDQLNSSTNGDNFLSTSTSSISKIIKPSSSMTSSSIGLPKMHSRTSSFSSVTSEKMVSSLKAPSIASTTNSDVLNPNSDDLEVGDKVYVNGSKPGTIRFLGITSFAPDKWSGIELDEPTGKNNGSVDGIKYFSCKPNYGLFVRPYRLTREPITPKSPVTSPLNGDKVTSLVTSNKNMTASSSSSSLATASSTPSRVTSSTFNTNLKIGDKVMVHANSGLKRGILRYLGPADFAAGNWAGVELNEATGKNDGSVAGKKYFQCQPNYGLFAPINKVVKDMVNGSSITSTTITKTSMVRRPSNLASSKRNGTGDSKESLASIASTTSHRSNRFGSGMSNSMTSRTSIALKREGSNLSSRVTGAATSSLSSSSSSALAKTLKEKEDQISHLLKEKDMESAELAKLSNRIQSLEEELEMVVEERKKGLQERESEIQDLRRTVEETNAVNKQLMITIEEEKKKNEMLEFRLEEEIVNKMEMKDEMERLIDNQKSVHKEDDNEMELFQLQEEIIKRDEKTFQVESSLENKKQEIQSLQQRIKELESDVSLGEQRQQRYLETIDELNLKLKKKEDDIDKMKDDLAKMNSESKKLQANMDEILKRTGDDSGQLNLLMEKLKKSESTRSKLEDDLDSLRSKLEHEEEARKEMDHEMNRMKKMLQEKEAKEVSSVNKEKSLSEEIQRKAETIKSLENQIEELIRSSGNSSESLTRVNEELKKKSKTIDDLKGKLEEMENKLEQLELECKNLRIENEQLTKSSEDKNAEILCFKKSVKEAEDLVKVKSEEKVSLEEQVKDLLKRITEGNNHLIQMNEDLKKKQQEIIDLEENIANLKKQLHNEDLEKRKLNSELAEMKRKDIEKSVELESVQKHKTEADSELDNLVGQVKEYKEKVRDLEEEMFKLKREANIGKSGLEEREETIRKLKEQLEVTRKEFDDYRRSLENKLDQSRSQGDSLIQELKKTIEMVQSENKEVVSENERLNYDLKKLMEEIRVNQIRHKEVLYEFEDECRRLESKLEEKDRLIAERDSLLEEIRKENAANIDKWRQKMDKEKENLLAKITQLETTLNENIAITKKSTIITSSNTSSSHQDYQSNGDISAEDREQFQCQIDFLNSVIVDMQRKNDELKARTQVLEEIGLSEFDDSSCNIRPVNGHLPKPPRIFCDICDMFDKHETEDCPKQKQNGSYDDTDYSNHSRHNGQRHSERSYCNNCEVFGHWTQECTDNESF